MSYLARYKVGLDARPLCYGMTGNSRYLFEALTYLCRDDSPFYFVLLANKEIDPIFIPFLESNRKYLEVKVVKKFGAYWLNFILPKMLKESGVHIFWGTLQLLPFWKLSLPSIVNYHDLNFVSAPATMAKGNYWQHRLMSAKTMKNADRILCLSKNTMTEIEAYRPAVSSKLRLVYPGVNKNEKNSQILPDIKEPYFFSIGTLEPRKNLETLIRAFRIFKESDVAKDFSLVLAGRKGWGDSALLQELVRGELKNEGILFIENPSEEHLSSLYRNAAIFFFPSLHEGFGLPILEALVEQKKCVVSEIPVFREIIEESVDYLVPPLQVQAWADSMLKIAKTGNFARKTPWKAEDWTWKKTAEKIEKELLLLCEQKYGEVKNAV